MSSIEMFCRRSLSTVYVSDAKRFRIRPVGVVSKKATGARTTLASIPSWNTSDAR